MNKEELKTLSNVELLREYDIEVDKAMSFDFGSPEQREAEQQRQLIRELLLAALSINTLTELSQAANNTHTA